MQIIDYSQIHIDTAGQGKKNTWWNQKYNLRHILITRIGGRTFADETDLHKDISISKINEKMIKYIRDIAFYLLN
jgi:hypothetical protein